MNTTAPYSIPRDQTRLALGVGLSLLLHLALVLTLAIRPEGPGLTEQGITPMDRSPLRLGIAKGSTVALDWMGFDTPTDHSATQADLDQSAFTRATPAPPAANQPESASSNPESAQPSIKAQAPSIPAQIPEFDAITKFARELFNRPPAPPNQAASQAQPITQDQPADQSANATENAESDGAVSDKDSSATSRDEPLVFRPGKVLARDGLDIKTVMPNLPDYARSVWGGPGRDPVVHLRFLRNGNAIRVRFEPGTQTGIPDIDEPILNAVKSWTATGEQLESIPNRPRTAGIDVTIRLMFR